MNLLCFSFHLSYWRGLNSECAIILSYGRSSSSSLLLAFTLLLDCCYRFIFGCFDGLVMFMNWWEKLPSTMLSMEYSTIRFECHDQQQSMVLISCARDCNDSFAHFDAKTLNVVCYTALHRIRISNIQVFVRNVRSDWSYFHTNKSNKSKKSCDLHLIYVMILKFIRVQRTGTPSRFVCVFTFFIHT